MENGDLEFMINVLIQRMALVEQINQDIMRTQIKEQGMITGLNSTVQQLKVQVNALSIRKSAQGGDGDGMMRSSMGLKG